MLLKENPFYILDVSISADRKKIAEAADEIGFLLGEEISREAQSVLTNPTRRLNAEMAWFPEANVEDIASIRNAISADQPINTSSLTGLSKLNAMVYNLGIAEYFGTYDLGFDIVSIDEQYNSIDLAGLKRTINSAREKAGMSAVGDSEVQECHRKAIEDIRKLINDKLKPYDEESYIDFVTVIGEQYVADKRHNAGPILFDIIDQYEIRMQSEIEGKADQIIQYVDLIKSEQDKDIIKKSIPKVIERVQAWDKYAQPLQCRSQATGLPHEISSKLAYEIRGLILFLNNEKQLTTEARDLASAMKAVFIELGEFKEVFSNDTKKLDEIEKSNQDAGIINEIQKEFEKIDASEKDLMRSGLEPKELKAFVALITSIDEKIRNSKLDKDTRDKLRVALFYRARKTSVDIYNIKHNPGVTQYLICVLTDLFSDIDEPRKKLQEDGKAIDTTTANATNMGNYKNFFNSYIGPKAMAEKLRKRKIIKRVIIAAAVLIFIVVGIINSQNSNKTRSGSYSGSSRSTYGSSSSKNTSKPTAKTTAKPTSKPTAKPTEALEKAFSASSKRDDKVYLKIISIEPSSGIFETDESSASVDYYHHLICKCKSEMGVTVWLYISTADYRLKIDPSFNTLVNKSSDTFSAKTIEYNPSATLHGTMSTPYVALPNNLKGRQSIITEVGNDAFLVYRSLYVPTQIQAVTLTKYTAENYFDISISGKEYVGNTFTLSYSVKPKSTEYAKSSASSNEIILKLNIGLYTTEQGKTPFQNKDYSIVLKKSNGYKASGTINIYVTKSLNTVYWNHSVESCSGKISK